MNKMWIFLAAVMALACMTYATDVNPLATTYCAMVSLCRGMQGLLPVAAMLMVLLAAVIYATGQMMGAETRARANVWATSCLTGALIGILISVIAPAVLQTINGGNAIHC